MAEFDPDAFLADGGGTAVADAPFDPDSFLAEKPFDPDEFLSESAAPTSNVIANMGRSALGGVASGVADIVGGGAGLLAAPGRSSAKDITEFEAKAKLIRDKPSVFKDFTEEQISGMQTAPEGYRTPQEEVQLASHETTLKSLREQQAKAAGVQQPLEDFQKLSSEASKEAQTFFGQDPARQDEFLSKLATGAGSLPPYIASAIAGGPVASMMIGALQTGQNEYNAAIEAGKPELADEAMVKGMGIGLTEGAGVGGGLGAAAKGFAAKALTTLRKAFEEGGQEWVQTTLSNLNANTFTGYDPSRPTFKGSGEAFAIGAILGGGVEGVTQPFRSPETSPALASVAAVAPATAQAVAPIIARTQPITVADPESPTPMTDAVLLAEPVSGTAGAPDPILNAAPAVEPVTITPAAALADTSPLPEQPAGAAPVTATPGRITQKLIQRQKETDPVKRQQLWGEAQALQAEAVGAEPPVAAPVAAPAAKAVNEMTRDEFEAAVPIVKRNVTPSNLPWVISNIGDMPQGGTSMFRTKAEAIAARDKAFEMSRKPAPAAPAPAPVAGTAAPGAKEPWQMTREDWLTDEKARPGDYFGGGGGTEAKIRQHQTYIERAIESGKPVPAEVLADYPDMAKQPQQSAPTPSTPARVQLRTGPQTFTVVEQLPPQKGDAPGEVYFRVKNERTGAEQTVEAGDMKPVKAKGVKATPAQAKSMRRKLDAGESGAIPASLFADIADFGARIYRDGMSFARWSADMVRHLGERVRSALKELWVGMLNPKGARNLRGEVVQARDEGGAIGAAGGRAEPKPGDPVEGGRPGEYYTRVAERDKGTLSDNAWSVVRNRTTLPDTFRGDLNEAAEMLADDGDLAKALRRTKSMASGLSEIFSGLTDRRKAALLFLISQNAATQRETATDPKHIKALMDVEAEAIADFSDLMSQGGKLLNIAGQLYGAMPMSPDASVMAAEKLLARMSGGKAAEVEAAKFLADFKKEPTDADKLAMLKKRAHGKDKKFYEKLQELFRAGALDDDTTARAFMERAGVKEFTPAFRDKLRKLYEDAEKAPDGMPKSRILGNIAVELAMAEPKTFEFWWNLAMSISYGNILGAFTTIFINNPLGSLGTSLETTTQAALSLKGQRAEALKGAVKAWARSFGDGVAMMRDLWSTGENLQKVNQFDSALVNSPVELLAKMAEDPSMPKKFKVLAKAGGQYRWVMRAMMAADAVIRWPSREAMRFVQSAAVAERKPGQSLEDAVDELNYPGGRKAAMAEARQQIKEERAAGHLKNKRDETLRMIQLMQEKLSPEGAAQAEESDELANYGSLLNEAPDDLIGHIHQALTKLAFPGKASTPTAKAVAGAIQPFTRFIRTSANGTRIILDYAIGYGAFRYALRNLPWRNADKVNLIEGAAGQRLTQIRLQRAYLGMILYAGIAGILKSIEDDDEPWIDFIGTGPESADERARLRHSKVRFNSVKVGDTYIPYNVGPLQPLSGILGAASRYRDNKKWPKAKDETGEKIPEHAGIAMAYGIANAVGNQSFTRGLTDFSLAITEGKTSFGETRGEFIGKNAAQFLPGNLRGLSQIDEIINGPKEKADGFFDVAARGIAFYSPNGRAVTILGDDVTDGSPIGQRAMEKVMQFSQMAKDETLNFAVQSGISIPVRQRKADGRTQTLREYNYYLRESGKRMRHFLEKEGGLKLMQSIPTKDVNSNGKTVNPRRLEMNKQWKAIRDDVLWEQNR